MYVQSDTLLLADVSENFKNVYFKISQLDSTKFVLALGLAWQVTLEKTKVESSYLQYCDVNNLYG